MRLFTIFLCLAVCGTSLAQVPQIQRVVMAKGDVSIGGREAILVKVDIAQRATTGRHSHNGDEVGYVSEGELEMLIDGEAPRQLKTGDGFIIPSATVHEARNVGTGAGRVIVTYVVEKDKPLVVPAK